MPTVSFADDCRVHLYQKVDNVEFPLLWWSEEDINQFRHRCSQTAKIFNGQDIRGSRSSDLHCLRGLEDMSHEKRKERKLRIRTTVQLVIDEQVAMRKKGEVDPQVIAKIYRELTVESEKKAQAQGLGDAEAVIAEYINEICHSETLKGYKKPTIERKGIKRYRSSKTIKSILALAPRLPTRRVTTPSSA